MDWLDRLTFREIEIINERLKQHSNFLYLMIEFPRFQCNNTEYSVFYFEKVFLYIAVVSSLSLLLFFILHCVYYLLSFVLSNSLINYCLVFSCADATPNSLSSYFIHHRNHSSELLFHIGLQQFPFFQTCHGLFAHLFCCTFMYCFHEVMLLWAHEFVGGQIIYDVIRFFDCGVPI